MRKSFKDICCKIPNNSTLFGILFVCLTPLIYAQDINVLKREYFSAKADSTKCRLLYELGNAYERTNTDSSLFYLSNALELATRTNNQKYAARIMYRIGYMNMYYIKDETKALSWFNRSVSIAKLVNDNYSIARCYQIMGIISLHQGIGSPTELLYKAIEFAKKDSDWRSLNDGYAILSNYFDSKHNYEEARKFTELAMEVSEKHDVDEWFDDVLEYCEILLKQGKKEQIVAYARKLEAAKPKLKKSKGEFVYLNNIGRLAKFQKKYDEAEKFFFESLNNEKTSSKVDTFHLYFIFKNLESLYIEQNSYKKAYEQSKKLTDVLLWLKEKRQTQNSKLEMTKLKANFDLEKKEVEIKLLETKQKQQRVLLVVIAIAALVLITFMIFLQQNRRKIQEQKDTLSSLNTTKDKLFAILSHDLRSPVASLKNYMMLINWGALTQHEFVDASNRLNTQLSNVGNTLDNVLNWTISQMEGIKPKPEKVNVSEIIEEKISMLQFTQEAKKIRITNDVSPIVEIIFDKNHFRIILRNLLQNALKFTNTGGNINFSLIKEVNTICLSIADDGIGISQENLETIFKLGTNNIVPGTSNEQGTGLGLTLVKELVELNTGKISVKSELGKGTTFTIICPAG